MHPNNPHRSRYDLIQLSEAHPELKRFIKRSPSNEDTIDFSDAEGVKALNKAILKKFYQVEFWDIPPGYLCPPVPGRVDYLYYLNDLIQPQNGTVRAIDIGTGSNLIYPLLGQALFNWEYTASDIDPSSVKNAETIVQKNNLSNRIHVKHQKNKLHFFKDILEPGIKYKLSMCNPPFHSSKEDAMAGNQRKLRNLGIKKEGLNFGGTHNELWCTGGEKEFISRMIQESVGFKNQVEWFTTLVSRKENLYPLEKLLAKSGAREVKIVEMTQGQKKSRFIAWNF